MNEIIKSWKLLLKYDLFSIDINYEKLKINDDINIHFNFDNYYDFEYYKYFEDYWDFEFSMNIIEDLLYIKSKKDLIILNNQSIWELIYLNQDIFKIIK